MSGALSFRGISKSYGGIHALRSVSFDVAPGEIHALVGANGAGKSTLLKILSGVIAPDAGEILLRGCPVRIGSPHGAHLLGIGLVPQETTLCENLSIAENIFLGSYRWLRPSALEARARGQLHDLGLEYDPAATVSRLSVAQKQLVQIVRALAFEPAVLALDEPTACLSEGEVAVLFRILRDLRSRGVTILFVSHRLKEIQEISDRATVLRDGDLVATLDAKATPREELVRHMAGREVSIDRGKAASIGDEALRVRDLLGVSFRVHQGEVLGWFGLVGAGRTEVARALFGVEPARGEIRIGGLPVEVAAPRDAIAQGIALVPEDRKRQGLVLQLGVGHNISLASLGRLSRWGAVSAARERTLVAASIEKLKIRCSGAWQLVGQLSGGNQQKVVLSKWLQTRPKVLILDEPTKGVDLAAKAELQAIVRELAREGTAVILISSELEEIRQMADRILVFKSGHLVGEFPGPGATDQELMSAAT
ncbi:MAG TPA: sugar ABC transporter ATP-binding protein [Planctomycetota bacterium]|nr:sugar ABC transporter ATP-binding protein [Planctomycetota bacterium]